MSTLKLCLPVLGLSLLLPASPQRRVKAVGPDDFEPTLKTAGEAFKAKRYMACQAELRKALEILHGELRKGVLACLPQVQGFRAKDEDSAQEHAAAQMFGVGAFVGNLVKRSYENDDGQRVDVQCQIDSAMVKSVGLLFDNAAFRPQGSEPIDYDNAKGLLEKSEDNATLKVIVDNKHYFELHASFGGAKVLEFFPQATVNQLIALLRG